MAPQTSIKLTYEDYAVIPDDGRRHEIIDGEHSVNPAPNYKHQSVILRLAFALHQHVSTHALGDVLTAPFDVVLGEHDVVQPDIIYLSNARRHFLTPANLQGPPDLLIEVLSSNREYDERVKYQLYERAGVLEYWIVDPDAESATTFRRKGDRFAATPLTGTLTTPLLPGFELRVADLFA